MPQLTSVQVIFSPDQINVMAIFPSAERTLFHIPSLADAGWLHVPVRVMKLWIIGFQISRCWGTKSNQVMSCFMDGNCNIISEILLVISYCN